MILGLSSYTYGWAVGVRGQEPSQPLDELALLDRVREHGLALLQIGDNLPLETFTPARLAALAQHAAHARIQIEIGARRLTSERVHRYAEIARTLGAKLIRFVADDADYQPTPDSLVRILRESLPSLDGITLGLENHDRLPARVLRGIIDRVASPQVGICLDTANSLGAGEGLETVVAALGPIAVNLHIKDFEVKRVPHAMGFIVMGRPAGNGFLDVRALLDVLAPFGRCRTTVLELWTPPEATLEETVKKESSWAAESVKFLKPFFA